MFDILRREIKRYRQRPFLEAVMASCAIVATADGEISFSERVRMDNVVDSLEQLRVFNPHEGVNLFNAHAEAIEANRSIGTAAALEAIRRGAGDDQAAAALLLRISIAISQADGQYHEAERGAVQAICDTLGIDPALVEA